MTTPITTILLDLDDTILHDHDATTRAFSIVRDRAVEVAGVDGEAFIADVKHIARDVWMSGPFPEWLHAIGTSEIEGLRARFNGEDEHWAHMREFGPQFRRETWTRALAKHGCDDAALSADLDALFEQARGEANPFMDQAEDVLRDLKTRYKLGMVTNGIPDVQRIKINATGLADLFDVIVISGEISIGKPKPEIFQRALDMLGSTPDGSIMVGDNFVRDIEGGRAAGIRGVWISLGRDVPEQGVAWKQIDGIAELPGIL